MIMHENAPSVSASQRLDTRSDLSQQMSAAVDTRSDFTQEPVMQEPIMVKKTTRKKSLDVDDISFASSSVQSFRTVKQLDLKAVVGKKPLNVLAHRDV